MIGVTFDADGKRIDDPIVEVLMDQAKHSALVDAVFIAQKKVRIAAKDWESAKKHLDGCQDAMPEPTLNDQLRESFSDQNKHASDIKSEIMVWASQRAARLDAEENSRTAETNLKACTEEAHAALERLVAFMRENA